MRTRHFIITLALAISGCAVELEPADPIGGATEALYGSFSTSSCSADETTVLTDAMRVGRIVAGGSAFEACMRSRITERYMACDSDEHSDDTTVVQLERALNITRGYNRADVSVNCATLPGLEGCAGIGDYGQDEEAVRLSHALLARVQEHGVDAFERADVAGTIWHEAMHQQGYDHADDDAAEECGYTTGTYARGTNSMPYIVGGCLQGAAIESRAVGWSLEGAGVSLHVGTHLASRGDLGVVARNLAHMRLPPASRGRYCLGEMSGACSAWQENAGVGYGGRIDIPEFWRANVVRVEIEPRVLVFAETEHHGTVQNLGPGELLANHGDLATVGNDRIRSIYVPPGLRVRACSDEGGAGHGAGTCAFFDAPVAALGTLEGRISYLEVVPVVTAFFEAGIYGQRQGFGPGVYLGRSGGFGALGDDTIRSLVVPMGMTARACTDVTLSGAPAGTCVTYSRSSEVALGSISYLEIAPMPAVVERLTVTRTAGGTGSVTSMPTGIVCGPSCIASYAARSEVRLRAAPGVQTVLTWAGCDRVAGNDCWVTMRSARTVTATFRDTVLDFACYDACLEGCVIGAPRGSTCAPACDASCRR